MTIGAVVISRRDGYGGHQEDKATHSLTSLINALDEVIYVDWNSPGDKTLFDAIKDRLPKTGRLAAITVTPAKHWELLLEVGKNMTPDDAQKIPEGAQHCVEVLARNIGLRRLKADFLISCNADVMCMDRESITDKLLLGTFHTVARRHVPFDQIVHSPGSDGLRGYLLSNMNRFGQHGGGSPLHGDRWSLISCPGDFQIAHRDVWYGIKGFEEKLIYRGYTDSNVQRKADFYGFMQTLSRDIPVFHFDHDPGTGASGGTTNAAWNDQAKALMDFKGTTNPETWGFSDMEFPTQIL